MDYFRWLLLAVIVLVMLILDLGVFHRKAHVVKIGEAVLWSVIWVLLAFLFCGWIHLTEGSSQSVPFLSGYLVEKSLSVDNLFVFIILFSYFAVPEKYQHKILFWGIIGAILSRAVVIGLGIVLISKFAWLTYLLGLFVIYTGYKTLRGGDERLEPSRNPVIRFLQKVLPVTSYYEGDNFFVIKDGKRLVTPLFIVLVAIEITDIIFALDSIPAILAITRDPFLVYSSNLFAILGLRAFYFALAGLLRVFKFMRYGISLILVIVGVKMLVNDFIHVPEVVILGTICSILLGTAMLSLFFGEKQN